jgi:hypothetical protein
MAFAELNPDTVSVEGLPTIDPMATAEPKVITLVLNDGTEAGQTFSIVIMDSDYAALIQSALGARDPN